MKRWSGFILMAVLAVFTVVTLFTSFAAAAGSPIKIGMIADKTGVLAAYGYSHEKVLKAAVKKINKDGGIAGRPVKLYVEDTESKASVATLKYRKLVDTYGVDFIIDSNSSGIAIACCPIAKELKTPYFPCAGATEISTTKGNRYVFQSPTCVREECKGAAKFAVNHIGKKWVTVVVNYSWGISNENEFKKYVTKNGGVVLKSIRVPMKTSDFLPYLKGKIPKEAEAVFFANFGSDFLSFIRDLYAIRPDIKKLGAVYVLSGHDPKKLGKPAEGLYCITPYPTALKGLDTKANRMYRKLIGVDANGVEIGTGKRFVLAYDWAVWESMFALKHAIEKSGWKSRKDTPKVIKALEGMKFKESVEFPQGDMWIRAKDHLTITGLYVEQIDHGKLKVVAKIPAKDVEFKPVVDRTKEPF